MSETIQDLELLYKINYKRTIIQSLIYKQSTLESITTNESENNSVGDAIEDI